MSTFRNDVIGLFVVVFLAASILFLITTIFYEDTKPIVKSGSFCDLRLQNYNNQEICCWDNTWNHSGESFCCECKVFTYCSESMNHLINQIRELKFCKVK